MNSDQNEPPTSLENAPPILQIAIKKFNEGEYFACHVYLEELWLEEPSPRRELYKGILQIGIGLRHLQRGKLNGARRLLENGNRLIKPFVPVCFGVDLLQLHQDVNTVLHRISEPNQPHIFLPQDAIQIVKA